MPAGGHSTLSEPESGRWHPAVLDVVEAVDELAYSNSILFHQSLSRTKGNGRPHQDWAVAFGYDGAKSVEGWLITDGELVATINTRAEAMRRRCRRVVERHGIKELIGGDKPGADLYWAAVAVLHDEGKVVVGAMRRDSSKEKRIRNDRGEDTERDSFWKLKIKHGYLYDGGTEDPKAPWPPKLTIDVHTGLPADDVLELRRRVRSAGPDPLAQPTHQVFRTNAQLQVAIKGVKHLMSKTHALIAIGVEMAAGRIVTDDGYPSLDEINSMVHTSDSLPEGAGGLTDAQAGVLDRLREGMPMWLDWPNLEDAFVTPMRSAYRVVDIATVTTWDQPSVLRTFVYNFKDESGETKHLCDAQMSVPRITNRLENPLQSTLMDIERLKALLRECEINDEEWSIFESCLCMDGFMVRKHTGNATNSPHARSLPLRACCQLHERDSVAECCGLFYPPDSQFDGRHEFDIHNHKGRPSIDPEQHHVVGQQAQVALIVAEHEHLPDHVKSRLVNLDICSGTQSQRKNNLRLGGMRTVSCDKRPEVDAFGVEESNFEIDMSGDIDDIYNQIANWLHECGIAMSRVAVITVSSDCKTTCTGNAHNCRDGAEPKLGTEGDTAREADKVVVNCMKLMARFQKERDLLYSGDHIDDG